MRYRSIKKDVLERIDCVLHGTYTQQAHLEVHTEFEKERH
jgi:hypothetical protein